MGARRRCDPGSKTKDGLVIRRPVSEDCQGYTGMWDVFKRERAAEAAQTSLAAFTGFVKAEMALEHCKLLGIACDHCMCGTCKTLQGDVLGAHLRAETARQNFEKQEDKYSTAARGFLDTKERAEREHEVSPTAGRTDAGDR